MIPHEQIEAADTVGRRVVLATVTQPGIAVCVQPHCSCPIQRLASGTLRDGVRAHYKAVHPEKGVS